VKGDNGVFDVVADGKLVFSKHRDGRFPDAAEIVRVLK
jgi:selT/selW/selH-like putative selenoprotein